MAESEFIFQNSTEAQIGDLIIEERTTTRIRGFLAHMRPVSESLNDGAQSDWWDARLLIEELALSGARNER